MSEFSRTSSTGSRSWGEVYQTQTKAIEALRAELTEARRAHDDEAKEWQEIHESQREEIERLKAENEWNHSVPICRDHAEALVQIEGCILCGEEESDD